MSAPADRAEQHRSGSALPGTVGRQWSAATLEAQGRLASIGALDASLAARCTYRVGGPAAVLVDVDSVAALAVVAEVVADTGSEVLVIGRGSNVLVADAGFDGIVIVLGASFDWCSLDLDAPAPDVRLVPGDAVVVEAGGAALLPVVARASVRAGLSGFEWAVGVPGSVGGAVKMNAGGHGADIAATLVDAEVFDLSTGKRSSRPANQLALGYRRSNLDAGEIVIAASFSLAVADPDDDGEARLVEIVRWRRSHQPGGANAGSVFANPAGDSAGRIIDSLGLKDMRVGSASVSSKHANFIQVDPDGSADDVFELIGLIRRRVFDETGIELVPENRLIGFERRGEPS